MRSMWEDLDEIDVGKILTRSSNNRRYFHVCVWTPLVCREATLKILSGAEVSCALTLVEPQSRSGTNHSNSK